MVSSAARVNRVEDPETSETTSEAETGGVHVHVRARYSDEHSHPGSSRWFFLYTIRISNAGETRVQLLNRH